MRCPFKYVEREETEHEIKDKKQKQWIITGKYDF